MPATPKSCRAGAPGKLEVRHVWCGDRAHQLEPAQIVADAIEEPLTPAEECRRKVDLHLVHEPRPEILLGDVRSPGERYVFSTGGSSRLLERCLDAIGDEGEGRSAIERERLAWVMREHEHRVVEWRVGSPPTVPRLVGVPRSGVAAEHVAAHHGGPDVGERFFHNRGAFVHFAAFEADHRAPDREWKCPLVQAHAAGSERIVHALVRTGDETIE